VRTPSGSAPNPYGMREDPRSTLGRGVYSVLVPVLADARVPRPSSHPDGVPVLDLVYVIGVLAVFTLVGVIAKGAEKL